MIEIVNQSELKAILSGENNLVFIDFYNDGCVPCRRMAPLVEQAQENYPQVKFVSVNAMQNMDLAMDLMIASVPTFVLFKGETELGRRKGIISSADLSSFIEENL